MIEHFVAEAPCWKRELLPQIMKFADSDGKVLITGKTGTGKGVVARAIHQMSSRANGPFVAVNCGAISANLIESVLFGHERGAFTGASNRHRGVFEQADSGSLFLDEIGELPPETQVHLLQALEQPRGRSSIRRLGSETEINLDVRIIAATNRDIKEAVKSGKLREDLYYRLNVLGIEIPPLRERKEDIAPLIDLFVRQLANGYREIAFVPDPEGLWVLGSYSWPGNVRELQNLVERSLAMLGKEATGISASILAQQLIGTRVSKTRVEPSPETGEVVELPTLEEVEKRAFAFTLFHTGWNRTTAAEILGISLRQMHCKIEALGLVPPADVEKRFMVRTKKVGE